MAFSGAVGCALDQVIAATQEKLQNLGYAVRHIKLSDYIARLAVERELAAETPESAASNFDRYDQLQTLGNKLRETLTREVLAAVAVSNIAVHRTTKAEERNQSPQEYVPERTAYLIDQLKNPAEVALLKAVYRDNFYLIGVLASVEHRKRNLTNESLKEFEAEKIMERDKKEDFSYGQQLDKTLKYSDLFIRNTHNNREVIEDQMERFLKLLHGVNGITPTQHEYAMYVASSAALRSACLSRQVGACISTEHGTILSTGCNDVPKPTGGLYTSANKPPTVRLVGTSPDVRV